jgi:outer membrane murein-binding lipoprotein Lpp
MRTVLIIVFACVSSTLLPGCSSARKSNTINTASSADGTPNTTDILSVDQKAGTFVALARRDHTTRWILARCGTVCPSPGKNFAGFWSLPASQVAFEVIKESETEGMQTQ